MLTGDSIRGFTGPCCRVTAYYQQHRCLQAVAFLDRVSWPRGVPLLYAGPRAAR